jgi:hypothetical protein
MGHASAPAAVAPETFIAGADLSTKKLLFLAVSADNTVNVATGPNDPVLGVQDDVPFAAAGAQVGVRTKPGPALVIAGEAITAGSFVTPGGDGRAEVAASTEPYHGIAITAATADGDIIEISQITGVTP